MLDYTGIPVLWHTGTGTARSSVSCTERVLTEMGTHRRVLSPLHALLGRAWQGGPTEYGRIKKHRRVRKRGVECAKRQRRLQPPRRPPARDLDLLTLPKMEIRFVSSPQL